MEKAIPVETCVGYLLYHDTVCLDKIKINGVDWYMIGQINGRNVTKNPGCMEWINFEIIFDSVQDIFSFGNTSEPEHLFHKDPSDPACFHIINDSLTQKKPSKEKAGFANRIKHYRLKTKDMIFHVTAKDYELKLV